MTVNPVPARLHDALSPDELSAATADLMSELADCEAVLEAQQRTLAALREDGSWSDAAAQDVIRTCLTTMERTEDRRRLVLKALARVDDGTYGTCESCGTRIAPDRLLARPSGTLCVDCAG